VKSFRILSTDDIRAENGIKIGENICTQTPVIYCINKKGRPEPVSSAIALKYEDHHFIVTASHTLRKFSDYSLGLIPGSYWIELDGAHANSDSLPIADDKFDVAVFKVEASMRHKIGDDLKFFDLKGFRPDHIDQSGNTYMIVGHPNTKVKIDHATGNRQITPFIYLSDLNQQDKLFTNQGFSKLTHQLFNYRRRRIYELGSNRMVQGPMPNGLSGAGIWKLSDLIVNDYRTVKYLPTGIVIEYLKDYSTLVVTRINVITEILRIHFGLKVEQSAILRDPNSIHFF
jgi:hypothetical protein